MFRVTVLTSSRADFGIYIPLLRQLQYANDIQLQIVAFGTHTSKEYGYTLNEIEASGFKVEMTLPFVLDSASPATVAASIARTTLQFSEVWRELPTDLVVCLGDRYEMFAAVQASVPFSLPVLHIHGGETTEGAIDNVFRHSLTQMSRLHFTCCDAYFHKVADMLGGSINVFNTGALSIDNLTTVDFLTIEQFSERYSVNMEVPTLLVTFHPETVSFQKNELYAKELVIALEELALHFQILITMPNADTMGNIIRNELTALSLGSSNIFTFESLGMQGYLSAMKHCAMMIGNTSSGFIEASYFPKWVINLGERQKGRFETDNIRTIPVDAARIIQVVNEITLLDQPRIKHPYGTGDAASQMLMHIKRFLQSIHNSKSVQYE